MVPLPGRSQADSLPPRARAVGEYRKSRLSLNHIQGCPLDCAYCIRHTYGLWDQRVPRALVFDTEAVRQLIRHRYFQPHVPALQIFNRATDPFLHAVRSHTLAVLAAGGFVHVTAEPSKGPIGLMYRELTESVTSHALACLYAADRSQRPAEQSAVFIRGRLLAFFGAAHLTGAS